MTERPPTKHDPGDDIIFVVCKRCDGYGYWNEPVDHPEDFGQLPSTHICPDCDGTGIVPDEGEP